MEAYGESPQIVPISLLTGLGCSVGSHDCGDLAFLIKRIRRAIK
jgi:hypothetical protein